MTLTGFAVCAHTFVRVSLYAQDRARDSYGVLTANKNELAACAFEGVSVLVRVLWSWVLVAERAFKTGGGAGRRCCQVAKRTRCGGAVSWLCRLRTLLFQPVACQQVVGFCLAIWVYAGVI